MGTHPLRHSRERGNTASGRFGPGARLDSRLRRSDAAGPVRGNGFTLVELMVVIVIIGLAATAVMLAMPDPGGSLQAEAERFAARAKAARDTAIVESRPTALVAGADGYEVLRRVEGEWRAAADYDWAEGTQVETAGPGGGRTRFDSVGLAEPMRLTLRRGGRQARVEIGQDGSVDVRH